MNDKTGPKHFLYVAAGLAGLFFFLMTLECKVNGCGQ